MCPQAVRIAPGHTEAWHNLGMTLLMLGRLDEAGDAFEVCLGTERRRWSDPVWYAAILGTLGRHARAEQSLERHLALHPDDPLATRFDLRFPVNELTVDEPGLREAVGSPDFPPQVPQSAREGTRTNLLSEALLDGAHHPEIRLRATDVRTAAGGYDVGVQVTFRDSNYSLRVPVTVSREAGVLVASGEFPLRQSDLGLKPFSVAMGTLVVLDDMKVRFQLAARP